MQKTPGCCRGATNVQSPVVACEKCRIPLGGCGIRDRDRSGGGWRRTKHDIENARNGIYGRTRHCTERHNHRASLLNVAYTLKNAVGRIHRLAFKVHLGCEILPSGDLDFHVDVARASRVKAWPDRPEKIFAS